MPFHRYVRNEQAPTRGWLRRWPDQGLQHAPVWASVDLRDGNQALAEPMDPRRKKRMFESLVATGFKDIEIGYPAASTDDFDFVRELVTKDGIPDDVTVSVFMPARPELIERTFESIRGAERATVHLCHATACLWREVVFGMTADEVLRMAAEGARQLVRFADRIGELLALALDLPRDFFAVRTDRSNDSLCSHLYPGVDPEFLDDQGMGQHTDGTLITLLTQDGPGLQLPNRSGRWFTEDRPAKYRPIRYEDFSLQEMNLLFGRESVK